MRLASGAAIKFHCDHDLAAEQGVARLHIPIMTNPGVDFRLTGRAFGWWPGASDICGWPIRIRSPTPARPPPSIW